MANITIHTFLAPGMLIPVLATAWAEVGSEIDPKKGGKIGGALGGFVGGVLGGLVVSGPVGVIISGVSGAAVGLGIGHGIEKMKNSGDNTDWIWAETL